MKLNDIHIVNKKRPTNKAQFALYKFLDALKEYTGTEFVVSASSKFARYGFDYLSLGAYDAADTLYALQSLGIIKQFLRKTNFPDEPRAFHYRAQYGQGLYAHGPDFFDESRAAWKAIGEAVERYAWSSYDFFSKKQEIKTYNEIKDETINIYSLAGFSEEQKRRSRELRFDENTPFSWIPTWSLLDKKRVLCPTQLVSHLYFRNNVKTPLRPNNKEPLLRWCITTGLANGKTLEDALVAGILEVIERDAFMITYLNKLSPARIDLEDWGNKDADVRHVVESFKRYELEIHAVLMPTDFPVNTILTIIIDRSGRGPTISVGANADFDLKKCFLGATSESLMIRCALKNRYKSNTIKNIKSLGRDERMLYWAQKQDATDIQFALEGKKITVNAVKEKINASENTGNIEKKLNLLVNELRKKNIDGYYVELGTPEIKLLGFHPVKVIIPELQPMHLSESIPYFGGRRLKEVPEKLGYTPAKELNKEPHPFP